jgi:hypothetical protein
MAHVQNAKCDRNLTFIFEKIAKLELQIKSLAQHLGLELKSEQDKANK